MESDYFSGGMQTNLDDVISCSPEWELKQIVAIPPTINEGEPSSPTGISDSSTRTSANEFAFDAIVKDLECWLDEISSESPLSEDPPVGPLSLKKETKIAYIPYSDEHLPKLSDLLITEPINQRSPKLRVPSPFSQFPHTKRSPDNNTDTPPQIQLRPDSPAIQLSTVRRDSGKFIIQVSRQKRSKSSSGSDDQEVQEAKRGPSPAKVYRSISLARAGGIVSTDARTMIRFHQSSFDSTSTGKGVFRPEASGESADSTLKRDLYSEEAKDRFDTEIISKSRPISELSDKSRELTSPLSIRLLAYGLEKDPSNTPPGRVLSRSNSAHLYEHNKIKLGTMDTYPVSRVQISRASPSEQQRLLGYVGSAVLRKPHDKFLSNSLSSLTIENLPSSTSTDQLSDNIHTDYRGTSKQISLSGSTYRLSLIKNVNNPESDNNTMPKRNKETSRSDPNVNKIFTFNQRSISGPNLAQQSTCTVEKGLQGKINALLNEAKKHQQPDNVSTRSESPVLQKIRELENQRKTAEHKQ